MEEIINLLKSENFQDKVLGIIMMEKEHLTEKILDRKDDGDGWHVRIRWFSELITDDNDDDKEVNVVVNGKLFSVWREGLCHMKKKFYHEVAHNELIYTDGSLDIQEIIKKWQELEKEYNQ